MVWAILIFLGVPLWICAAGITITVLKNRGLRKRPGDIPVRVKRPGKTRWARGHAIWVSDVFAWRASPASWNEGLVHVTGVKLRSPSDEERHELRRLGDDVRSRRSRPRTASPWRSPPRPRRAPRSSGPSWPSDLRRVPRRLPTDRSSSTSN